MTTVDLAAGPVARVRQGPSRQLVALVVVNLAAAAWLIVAFTHSTSLDHHALGGHQPGLELTGEHTHGGHVHLTPAEPGTATSPLSSGLLVLTGWAVMVVAMMLPPALPLLETLRRLTRRRRAPAALLALGAALFVGVWVAVGALMVAGDTGLHWLTERLGWQGQAQPYVAGAVLALAGIYQLTPLKQACLRACRSPRSFALAHWRGTRPAAVEAGAVAVAYGVVCVGCCWALMAVSLAVGSAALAVMVAIAVVMAAERLVPWGRRLTVPVGLVLLLLAALTLAGVLDVAGS